MTEPELIGVADRVTLVQYYGRLYGGLKFAADRCSEQARRAYETSGRSLEMRTNDAERYNAEAQRLRGEVTEMLAEAKGFDIDEPAIRQMADVMRYEREMLVAHQIAARLP